jgi:hypothetical protein
MWHFFHSALRKAASVKDILSITLGAVDVRTLLQLTGNMQSTESGFVGGVLLANLPQLILSAVYSIFNRVITTFALSAELNHFALRRKGLRVSVVPQGDQKSEFFLQLPYRFALPVMLFSGILHWLCSQSFFLVSIIEESQVLGGATNSTLVSQSSENLTWGYSPQAILILAILIMLMFIILIGFGLMHFKSNMPMSGSCSAVISAMCHLPPNEDGIGAALGPLMWGVTVEERHAGVDLVECSFSSSEVRQPVEEDMVRMVAYTGKAYKGWIM